MRGGRHQPLWAFATLALVLMPGCQQAWAQPVPSPESTATQTPVLEATPPAPPADQPPSAAVEVTGEVIDARGFPVQNVSIFAVESGTSRVKGAARSGPDGRFRMKVAPRPHEFGIMSPRWLLASFDRLDGNRLKLSVVRAFAGDGDPTQAIRQAKAWVPIVVRPKDEAASSPRSSVIVTDGPSVGVLTGNVKDDSGALLPGVRILAVNGLTRKLSSVARTDREGRYSLVTRTGVNRLFLFAPGLTVTKTDRRSTDVLDFVMSIDAEAETITVYEGRVLRFRMNDSSWPEYLPPPQVAAELKANYGIDTNSNFCPGDLLIDGVRPPERKLEGIPGDPFRLVGITCPNTTKCPATAWQRQCQVPRFWWLRVLQVPPPNPFRRGDRWWEELIADMQAAEKKAKETATSTK